MQQTIGNGLSYARKLENGLIDEFIMKELNKIDNEEMRRGYGLGIYNQRGVRWIDPEGKPELQLAEKYKERAEIAERMEHVEQMERAWNLLAIGIMNKNKMEYMLMYLPSCYTITIIKMKPSPS